MSETHEQDDAQGDPSGRAGTIDDVAIEAVDADRYGSGLATEEIVRRHLQSGETSGYAYIDGGQSFGYPRLGLTDAERTTFLEGLAPAIERIYASALNAA